MGINTEIIGHFRFKRETHRVDKLLTRHSQLSPEEQELFNIDVRTIDLLYHAKEMMYGTGRFFNNSDLLPPGGSLQQILKLNSLEFNHDVKFALRGIKNFNRLDLATFSDAVMNGQKFQNFLEMCFGPNNSGQTLNSLKNLPTVANIERKTI